MHSPQQAGGFLLNCAGGRRRRRARKCKGRESVSLINRLSIHVYYIAIEAPPSASEEVATHDGVLALLDQHLAVEAPRLAGLLPEHERLSKVDPEKIRPPQVVGGAVVAVPRARLAARAT